MAINPALIAAFMARGLSAATDPDDGSVITDPDTGELVLDPDEEA